jgi:hypothetical protein
MSRGVFEVKPLREKIDLEFGDIHAVRGKTLGIRV